jgi:hypothetical protein
MDQQEFILYNFPKILNEYLNHMKQSELLRTIPNSTYIICIGINSIIHIFKIVLIKTKNMDTTIYFCQKAYYGYLEYIEQMNKTQLLHNLKFLDAITFIYKNVLNDIYSSQTNQNITSTSFFSNSSNIQNKVVNVSSFTPPAIWEVSMVSNETENTDNKNIMNHKVFLQDSNKIDSVLYRRRFEMGHPSGVSLQIVGDIRPSENSNVPFEFFKGLNIISFMTQKLLFFPKEFNFENGEHYVTDSIIMDQLLFILNNYMKKYLLLFYSKEFTEKEYIFDYIMDVKNHLQFDFQDYCEYLKNVYKSLKKMTKIPSNQDCINKYNEMFFIEENQKMFEKYKKEKNLKSIVKYMFSFS